MIDVHNQTEIDKNYLVAKHDPNRDIYGTDGVLCCINPTNGKIYRAIETVANMSNDLTDITKWVSTDVIHNQDSANQDLGAIKIGLSLVLTADLKLNYGDGTLNVYDSSIRGYKKYSLPAQNGVTFDYILADGTVVDSAVTDIDPQNYDNAGTKTTLSRSTHATFQRVYSDVDGNIKVIRGGIEYKSLNQANYKYISEEIANLQAQGLYYIGGLLLAKSCTDMTKTAKARKVYASKLGESQVGSGGSLISKLKDPIADITELKAIEAPENGEVRQELSYLPKVVLWAFNTTATTGTGADDGTTGFWNKIEAESTRELDTANADFTAEPNTDYIVDASGGAITATVPNGDALTKGKIISFKKGDNSNNDISIVNNSTTIYVLTAQNHSVEILLLDGGARVLSEYNILDVNINRADVGRIVFQMPNPSLGIFPLDGSTVTDKLLAEHISGNSSNYEGFTVSGDEVTLPDWRGHILYGAGGLGLEDKIGKFVDQAIQRHRHSIGESYSSSGGGYVYESGNSRDATYCHTDYTGGTYNRVKGFTAQLCILGTTYFKLDDNSTIATAITISFNNQTVDGGDTQKTIYEGVHRFIAKVDLPIGKELDTVTNAVIDDRRLGYISFWQNIGGGDFDIDINVRDKSKTWQHETFTDSTSINTTNKIIKEWSEFNKSAGDVVELSYRVPVRNDSSGWGGAYLYIDYSVDSGSNWTRIFDSGYDRVMINDAKGISSFTGTFIVDIAEVTNSDKVRFRYWAKTYTGDGRVNNNHGIGGHTGNNGYTTLSLKVLT